MERPFLSKLGFTLSELLIASGIMAFVLVGLLHLFITCIFLNESNRNLSVATAHGQYVLEEMKNTNFTNFKNGSPNADTYWDWNNAAINSNGLSVLNSEAIATDAAWVDAVTKDRLDITVTVSWKDFGVRDRSLVLRTLITEP
jgi:Tfp pilus assembly protein PilW